MARAERQQRWRQRSGRRRVEAYLPEDTAERLDALAEQRGESRAQVLGQLIEAAATVELPASGLASGGDTDTADMVAEAPETGSETTEAAETAHGSDGGGTAAHSGAQDELPAYKRRKAPGQAPGGGDAEYIEVDGVRVGLVWRAPAGRRWRSNTLRTAVKPFEERTRTRAIEMMLKVERPHER